MKKVIRFHTAYLGHTGYAAHARGLIRHFYQEYKDSYDIRVRNCSWSDLSELNSTDLEVLETITLRNGDYFVDQSFYDFSKKEKIDLDFKVFDKSTSNIDIVLLDQNNIYYHVDYDSSSFKIAYLVWESTEIIHDFFELMKNKFDGFFVVTPWHKEVLINLGIKESSIWIVPEGLSEDILESTKSPNRNKNFTASFFGRWDYRKSVQEILSSFLEEFPLEKYPNIVINLSADNPFATDNLQTTINRLRFYGIEDSRIRILSFVPREEYVKILSETDLFLNCARAEGWNIPLFEAIAMGVPVTYCDYGAPKYFTEGYPGSVKYKYLEKASRGYLIGQGPNFPGYYCEPDFDDFKIQIRKVYDEFINQKQTFDRKEFSLEFKKKWKWSNAVDKLVLALDDILNKNESTYLVIAHCDSPEKINILDDCISSIGNSKFKIVSYLEPIEKYKDNWIQVEDNPTKFLKDIEKYPWINWPIFIQKHDDYFYSDYFSFVHHWSAWKLVKVGLNSIEGTHTQVVNYDYIVNDFKGIQDCLINHDAIFFKWKSRKDIEGGIDWNGSMLNGSVFYGKREKLKLLFNSIENEHDFYLKGYSFFEQAIAVQSKMLLNSKILEHEDLVDKCKEWDIISRKIYTFFNNDSEIEYCLFKEDFEFYLYLLSDSDTTLLVNGDKVELEKNNSVTLKIDMPLLIEDLKGSKLFERKAYNYIGKRTAANRFSANK